MNDTFVSTREFDGFTKRVDNQHLQVSEMMASLHGKVDSLLVGSRDEAKAAGAMESSIKSMDNRMQGMEGRFQKLEEEVSSLRDAMTSREIEKADRKIGWVGQVVLVLVGSFAGGIVGRYLK